MPIREKEFQAQVIQLAKLTGWLLYHTHNSRRSVAGFPDLILLRGPRLLAVELKVGKNKPRVDQLRWLQAFIATGSTAAVWTPDDWPEIERQLR